MTATDTRPIPAPERLKTPPSIIAAILGVSAVASLFLFWLVYYHAPADTNHTKLLFLPSLNALFNGLSAIALVIGFVFVKSGKIKQHRSAMFTAFVFSTLFLVSYIANHALHGEYRLPIAHVGALWNFYFWMLLSHITLSVVVLPLILITFFFSLSQRFQQHRKIARWTFPIWLYVSVTGVLVAVIQAVVHG
jgi:putative membrane protein